MSSMVPPTPPSPSASPAPAPPAPRGTRPAARVIALLTAALGVGVLVATVFSIGVPPVSASVAGDQQYSQSVDGVTTLDVDVAAATLTVRFDDVEEASLDVSGAERGDWRMARDGSTLRVSTPHRPFWSWFRDGNEQATLTLPDELEGSDADLSLGAGSLQATGRFGELSMELGAGDLDVSGAAKSLRANVNAGKAQLDLADVSTADLTVNAGDMNAQLTGSAPDEVRATVNAGSLDMVLPDEAYDVDSNVSAGDLDNQLATDPGAPHRVIVDIAAGDVQLRTR